MYLKSLELFGFKSFADRTQLIIEPGITTIVGPNGCGKSNILDGVRWVLGEKQAKNIRGEKMEDIIFNGTDGRKPLSLAEVSITIDNTNNILDIDSTSVKVSRRVFRDGESEYLINKSPVRLKDIEKLFMDTGIGKTSYSVMEQGKIDMILSTRADDRRYFFEEAAGISRFKLQKKESERKLENTSENLARINDIIKEIERERDIKSKQAEKTREYLSIKNRLIDNDIRLNYIKYLDSNSKRDKLKEEIEELKKERESISAKVSKISAENESDEKLKTDIQLQLFELDKELHEYHIKSQDIDSKTEKNRSLMKEEYNRRESIKHKIEEREAKKERLKEEKLKNEKTGVEINEKLKADSEKLKSSLELKKIKNDDIKKARNRIEENKKSIRTEEIRLKELRDNLEVIIRKLLDAIANRKAELTGSENERQEVKKNIFVSLFTIQKLINEAIADIDQGRTADAREAIRKIDVTALETNIKKFENYEDGFRSILFDKTGIHAEKESLDNLINEKVSLIDNLASEINELEAYLIQAQSDLENLNQLVTDVEKNIIRNENEHDWIEKHIKSLSRQIEDIAGNIDNYREDIVASEKATENLLNEIKEWGNLLSEFNDKSEALRNGINKFTDKRGEVERNILKRKDVSKKDIEKQEKIIEKIGSKEKLLIELDFKINSIEEYLWTEYEKRISALENYKVNINDRDEIQDVIKKLKDEIQALGPINNLAIEEYKDLQKRYEYYAQQRDDIAKAREDILSVIADINKTSVEMFITTFETIKQNLSDVFKKLFEGGDALIELTDVENVLESGIEITARPPGKKPKSINMLSGGERTLTAIALLFATYMVRPSPFCFLDEIDAALDEQNIGRFLRMLQQFSATTQFIIITHNKKTISIGESIYGITMEEAGVSKIVSLKMKKEIERVQ